MDYSLLKNIKMLVLDVDGVLTDGLIWLDSNNQWKRFFCIRDGVGIKLLKSQGYKIGVITGGHSEDVTTRVKFLGVDFFYDGKTDKTEPFADLLEKSGLKASEVLYMGDEVYDVPLLEKAGFAATVPGAIDEAKAVAQYVTQAQGGGGAVREVCDMLSRYGFFASVEPKKV